jgi:DNA-binding CsgD family transcriptional regulator
MENTQLPADFFVYVCSRNPIVLWAIEGLLSSDSPHWRFGVWSPKQLLIVPEGVHILLIDACSIPEWPDAVRKWTDAGHRTILLVAESWDVGGADLRALHLGVRGIVHVSRDFIGRLSEAIGFVAKGQLFASEVTLEEFYGGSRRLRPRCVAPHLSFREDQVMDLLMQGFSNRRIGTVLGISERTAKFHVGNILHKLQVTTRRQLLEKYGNIPDQTPIGIVS